MFSNHGGFEPVTTAYAGVKTDDHLGQVETTFIEIKVQSIYQYNLRLSANEI